MIVFLTSSLFVNPGPAHVVLISIVAGDRRLALYGHFGTGWPCVTLRQLSHGSFYLMVARTLPLQTYLMVARVLPLQTSHGSTYTAFANISW